MEYYDTKSGKVVPAPKPELVQTEPRGIQRGFEAKIKVQGSNLLSLTQLKLSNTKLSGELLSETAPKADEVWIRLTAEADLTRVGGQFCVMPLGGGPPPEVEAPQAAGRNTPT